VDNLRLEIQTRKLSAPELAALAFEVYRKRFGHLALAGFAVFIPIAVFSLLAALNLIRTNPLDYITVTADGQVVIGGISGFLRSFLSMIGINAIFSPLFVAAVTYAARRHVEETACALPGLIDASLSKWGKLVFTAIIYYVITALAAFMIIPGVYFAVAASFYPNVIADGDPWGFKAFRDSMVLVRGRWFRTFGFLAVVDIASAFVTAFVQWVIISLLSALGPASVFFESLAANFAGMYFTVIIALWYINRRYIGRRRD